MEPTVAGHTTPAGHGRAGGLLRKGTIGPLVDVDARGVRQGMVLGPVLFSIGTIATLRQLESSFPNASFTAYLDDVTVAAPPGMLGQVCEATSRAMRALGIETNEDKTEVLHTDGPVDMPAEYIRPFARVLGAGIANDPESELITRFVQRKAEETDRLFRAIVELPFAKHTQWRLLSVSALPRVTFLLRTHAPVHTRAAAEWFDDRVTGVLGVIMDGPVTKRARDIAALPVRRGGCGLRRQKEIAEFAYACLGEKGKQHALTDELMQNTRATLYETLQGPDRKVFVSNTAAGAGRPLTDPQVACGRTEAFHLPTGTTTGARGCRRERSCVCGADASNEHVHMHATPTKPADHTPRHDQHDVRKRFATMRIPMRHGTAPDGGEPAATGHPHRGTRHVRDHRRDRHIRRAGDGICVRGVHGGGRPTTRCTGPPHAKATKVPSLGTGQRAGL
ncbi:hypothetical protein TcYC6_0029910 [Trypanosoma cruzi]|nr:hypothetical protein TcYC6_0029910 [Trypanosoma cruzi]